MTVHEYPDLTPLERVRIPEYVVDSAVSLLVRPTDIVLVSGFWRSGTTWLLESLTTILDAKSVFEPFHPASTRTLYRELLADRDDLFRENFMPYWGEHPFAKRLETFFRAALWSRLAPIAIRQLRSHRHDALKRRIVAKVVRGHLCLPRIRDAFEVPIIHVRRDIRAIVASIRRTDWAWQFDRLSLRELLLEVEDGRQALFEPWRNAILRWDREPPLIRVAAYWALVEKTVEEALADGNRQGVCIAKYEDLVRDPEASVADLLAELEVRPAPEAKLAAVREDSSTTSRARRGGLSVEERIAGWLDEIEPSERSQIEDIVAEVGMTDHLEPS